MQRLVASLLVGTFLCAGLSFPNLSGGDSCCDSNCCCSSSKPAKKLTCACDDAPQLIASHTLQRACGCGGRHEAAGIAVAPLKPFIFALAPDLSMPWIDRAAPERAPCPSLSVEREPPTPPPRSSVVS